MTVDCLIVGQGIAGTLLSYRLLAAGKTVLVIDDGAGGKASRVAGAVINPLSGKNRSPSPGAAYLIPSAVACYRSLEALLGKPFLRELPLYHFADADEMPRSPVTGLAPYFHIPGIIAKDDVWLADAAALLDAWKAYLAERNAYLQATWMPGESDFSHGRVRFRDWEADHIVFCEGAAAARHELFGALPFTRNRGEALLLDIPGLPADALYHRRLRLAPRADGLFWCGSNYRWQFDDLGPDVHWRDETVKELESWLKLPFELKEHIVAERPTTAGQVPLVGFHPGWQQVGILNGLGTRGFSAGPFWAGELTKKMTDKAYSIRHYNEAWLRQKLLA